MSSGEEKEEDPRVTCIKYLRDECDHCIMSPEYVDECNQLFGMDMKTHVISERWQLDDPEGDNQGLGAHEMAEDICEFYKVSYAPKYGKGSQLAECCKKLLEFFASPVAPTYRPKEPQSSSTSVTGIKA